MARLESIQKQFLIFALGRQRLPDSYALPPYADCLDLIGLDEINHRHKLACVSFVHDSLLGCISSRCLRERISVNRNRRGRHSRYLYETFHRTDYGRHEPLNKSTLLFNEVAHIFLEGLSRTGFRRAVMQHYREQSRQPAL